MGNKLNAKLEKYSSKRLLNDISVGIIGIFNC